MKKIFLLSLLGSTLALSSSAQMGFGVEAGLNFSNYNVKRNGVMNQSDFRNGGRIGILSDMALTDNLFFQPGIYYVNNGYKTDITGGFNQINVNSIEIPLYLQYKIGMLGVNRIFLGAGPYMAWNKDGTNYTHTATIDSKSDLKVGSKVTDVIRPFDIGAGINFGYQVTAGLFVRARAQMGILNQYPGGTPDSYTKSYGFSISAGYLFYTRDKSGKMKINRDRNPQSKNGKGKKK